MGGRIRSEYKSSMNSGSIRHQRLYLKEPQQHLRELNNTFTSRSGGIQRKGIKSGDSLTLPFGCHCDK